MRNNNKKKRWKSPRKIVLNNNISCSKNALCFSIAKIVHKILKRKIQEIKNLADT